MGFNSQNIGSKRVPGTITAILLFWSLIDSANLLFILITINYIKISVNNVSTFNADKTMYCKITVYSRVTYIFFPTFNIHAII